MCELLVRLVDKTSDDPYLDAQLTKRGDVVVIVEDGHQWGRDELSSAQWQIVKVPGVNTNAAASFLAEEPETNPSQPNRMRQRRLFCFDLDAPTPTTFGELMSARKRKPSLPDPNEI